ncbi:MAG: methyltransferase domain-containing protein [Anaerolineae bacterium]|nr:methyltransferase domain-containing protein [Anaerolineae bacterium]
MKVLLTGFTPFLDVDVNPSALIIQHIAGQAYPGLDVVAEVLPTEFDAAGSRIEALISEHRPDAVLCLGVAARRDSINLERVAQNRDNAEKPDNAGVIRENVPIITAGPDIYPATLPLEGFKAALDRHGIPAVFSDDAGAYVCNHVFYRARHAVEQLGGAIPCGFIHVPGMGDEPPGLPLDTMIQAVEMCLGEVVSPSNSAVRTVNYDALAAQYAPNRRIHPGVLQRLIETGALYESDNVLEVGCGTGNYISALMGAVGCTGWGIDPSAQMLAFARQKAERIHLQTGYAHETGLPSDTFRLVFTVDVIHHLSDYAAYFREAYRLLTAGGKICTVTDSEAIIRARQPLSTYFPETVVPELARYPRISVLEALMAQAGFTDIRQETVENRSQLTDISPYREKSFSVLHLITEAQFQAGITRMENDLQTAGSIEFVGRYVLVWGTKPAL